MPDSRLQPMPWWLTAFLLVVLVEALVIGLSGYFIPRHMTIPVPVSPLNARFIGALYLTGACVLAAAALSRALVDARIVLFAIVTVTTGLLLISIFYWSNFGDGLSPYVWVVSYVVDPIVGLIMIHKLNLWRAARPGWHRLSPLFTVLVVLLGLTGLVLLLLPGTAVDHWPWAMNRVLARLYSTFFLGYAACGVLCAFEARSLATRAMRISYAALGPLVIIASLQHLNRFDSGAPRWIWFLGFAIPSLAVLLAFLPELRARPEMQLAPAPDAD